MAGRKPGTPKTGGRKKGTPNKINALLKDAILQAAQRAGGGGTEGTVNYLTEQASANPTAFMGLLGKVLPMTVQGAGGDGEVVVKVITGVDRGDEQEDSNG